MQYAHPEYLTSTEELADIIANETARQNLRLYDASVVLKPRYKPPGYKAEPGIEDYRAAHIPGAAFLDLMGKLSDRGSGLGFTMPAADQLEASYREAGISDASRVVFYSSSHMMWATRAWWMLHSCGHKNVSVLNGGLAKWQTEGRPTESGENSYVAGNVSVVLSKSKWASKEDVFAAIDAGETCTINALSPDVYSGQAEMHYGRKGHIPGSCNLHYADLLEAGCLRPANELAALFEVRGILGKPEIITYCGGGISATIDALALGLLGHAHVSVYDGSMSEWVADDDLPLTLGEDEPA